VQRDVDALVRVAQAALGRGDNHRCVQAASQALEPHPNEVDALLYRGWALYRTRADDPSALEGALRDFDHAISLRQDQARLYVRRARCHEALAQRSARASRLEDAQREREHALIDYGQALRVDPDDGEVFYYRAHTRFAAGDGPGARADYQAAIRCGLQPRRERRAKQRLAELRQVLDRDPDAEAPTRTR
jgi:tetratricopeptide (TPR) repeat protein